MEEKLNCFDPEVREILVAILRTRKPESGGDMSDAKWHLSRCRACNTEYPDAQHELVEIHYNLLVDSDFSIFPSDLLELRVHIKTCPRCQERIPPAISRLQSLKYSWDRRTEKDLEQIQHQYLTQKHQLLAEESVKENPDYEEIQTRLLGFLLRAADKIQFHLQFVHENDVEGGYLDFHVLLDKDRCRKDFIYQENERQIHRLCAQFIGDLAEETQYFLFTALLAQNILEIGRDPNYPCDESGRTEYVKERTQLMNCWLFLQTVELAAKEFLAIYLHDQSEAIKQFPGIPKDLPVHWEEREASKERFEERFQDVFDSLDSIKAVQDELLRISERLQKRPEDFETSLHKQLGGIYLRLERETQECLKRAECFYNNPIDSDGYMPTLIEFANAFDREFTKRIIEPVVEDLLAEGKQEYNPSKIPTYAFIRNGRPNTVLTLGQKFHYLKHDPEVRKRVEKRGIAVDLLLRSGYRLTKRRNSAAHFSTATIREADEVRDLLLGPSSIFKLLFPEKDKDSIQ